MPDLAPSTSLLRLRGVQPPNPTAQECRILRLMAEGKSRNQIAAELGITWRTVDSHKVNLYRRMGFTSIVDAVHYALEHGLVSNKFAGSGE